MTARQTIIHVRGGRTDLSAEVASLLPSAMGAARKTIRRERHNWTSFCPLCGGNKTKRAMRCANCRNQASRERGHRSAAARSLIGEAITRAHPNHGDPKIDGPTWSRRAKGDGVIRRQAWERQVLVNGKWVPESQTVDGREMRETANEAIRRLRQARP